MVDPSQGPSVLRVGSRDVGLLSDKMMWKRKLSVAVSDKYKSVTMCYASHFLLPRPLPRFCCQTRRLCVQNRIF